MKSQTTHWNFPWGNGRGHGATFQMSFCKLITRKIHLSPLLCLWIMRNIHKCLSCDGSDSHCGFSHGLSSEVSPNTPGGGLLPRLMSLLWMGCDRLVPFPKRSSRLPLAPCWMVFKNERFWRSFSSLHCWLPSITGVSERKSFWGSCTDCSPPKFSEANPCVHSLHQGMFLFCALFFIFEKRIPTFHASFWGRLCSSIEIIQVKKSLKCSEVVGALCE